MLFSLSEDAKDLLLKMLQYNPSKRISCLEALNHRYFTSDMSFLSKFNKIVPSKFQLNLTENEEKTFEMHEFFNKDQSKNSQQNIRNKEVENEEKCKRKYICEKYYNRKDKGSYIDYIDKEFLKTKKY